MVFTSLENLVKEIYEALLQRHGLRRISFCGLGFRLRPSFRSRGSTSSHDCNLLLSPSFQNLTAYVSISIAPALPGKVGSVLIECQF
jgi:hypothetical protein